MPRIHTLRGRIVVFFGALLTGITLLGSAIVQTAILRDARHNIDADLELGARVLARQLEQRSSQLMQSAQVLAGDFAFREAIAMNDRNTVVSALENHGKRIGADTMLMIGLDRRIHAATLHPRREGSMVPFPDLLEAATTAPGAAIIHIEERLYQIVVIPVKAPVTIGWIAMGFLVNDTVARDLAALTGLDVSFMRRTGDDPWTVLSSSLNAADRSELQLRASAWTTVQGVLSEDSAHDRDKDHDLSLISPLTAGGGSRDEHVVIVIEKSLRSALAPFNGIRIMLGVVALSGMIFAVLGSVLIARGITQPLQALTAAAQGIGSGDYTRPPLTVQDGEVGALAQAFNHMLDGIARREKAISDLAYRDALTGLPNRAAFRAQLVQAMGARDHRKPISILLINLNHFKGINDALGHVVGDKLLVRVGQRLQSIVPGENAMLAHQGGDEFSILLPGHDSTSARQFADALISLFEEPFPIEGQIVDIAITIGIACHPEHVAWPVKLLRAADVALTKARQQRVGVRIYSPEQDQRLPARLSLLSELREAVQNDKLTLLYQPKVDVASGRVAGVEALVRWVHPGRGFVPPDQFIPYAEQTGYIRAITQWVLNQALNQQAAWRSRGIDLHVGINLSARDLLHAELVKDVAGLLSQHAVPAGSITLEITESAMMDDPAHALHVLKALHKMGLVLAIDDFGTGYSSLSYLKSLPVDELKIDKSFVIDLKRKNDDGMIVRSTVGLAHNLGLKVVAEGVESAKTLSLLYSWGCDLAQGYYISKPVSAEALEQWLATADFSAVCSAESATLASTLSLTGS